MPAALVTLTAHPPPAPPPQEVNRVSEVVTSLADPSANVIFGAVIDDQASVVAHVVPALSCLLL